MRIFFRVFFILFVFKLNALNYFDMSSYLKFMYKPSKETVDEILISNLEKRKEVKFRLINYYLDIKNFKMALFYSKNLKADSGKACMLKAKVSFIQNNQTEGIKFLKKALFDYNFFNAFYLFERLYHNRKIDTKLFENCLKKAYFLKPEIVKYYYPLLKNKITDKKKLFVQYLAYSDDFDISENDFKSLKFNKFKQVYYLEKIIMKKKYKWSLKLFKKILANNPHLINLRRILILITYDNEILLHDNFY